MELDMRISRLNTGCIKWDELSDQFGRDDLLPMWIADTEFPAPEAVLNALRSRMEHPVFGYTMRPPKMIDSFCGWLQRRHNFRIPEESVCVCDSVLAGLASAINALTEPGDSIVLQTPVYDPFYHLIEKNGRVLVKNPLVHEDGQWRMDFEGLEQIFAQGCRTMLLCNPHNPIGRVWTREELSRLADLVKRYDVIVFSDDIHSDLIAPGNTYTPLASVSDGMRERVLTSYSTSKTFNIAGIKGSYCVIENPDLRERFVCWQDRTHAGGPNIFGCIAMEAAYRDGDAYCDNLCQYIYANMEYVKQYIDDYLPQIRTQAAQGTYLMLWDCSAMGLTGQELKNWFVEHAGVVFSAGSSYGEAIADCVRVNVACSRSMLEEVMNRVRQAFEV